MNCMCVFNASLTRHAIKICRIQQYLIVLIWKYSILSNYSWLHLNLLFLWNLWINEFLWEWIKSWRVEIGNILIYCIYYGFDRKTSRFRIKSENSLCSIFFYHTDILKICRRVWIFGDMNLTSLKKLNLNYFIAEISWINETFLSFLNSAD